MSVYAFGSNVSSQLGPSEEVNTSKPVKLDFFDDKEIIMIESGYLHTFIHTNKGLFSFGCNDDGQLGREGNEDSFLEVKVPQIKSAPFMTENNVIKKGSKIKYQKEVEIKQIQAGGSFSALLTKKGHLFITGTFRDSHGVFGLTKEKKNSFYFIPIMSKVKEIKAGKDFLLIKSNNNDLWGIGNNDFKQLREHPFRNKNSLFPTKIQTKIDFFGAGANHFLFVKKGLFYKRGLNNYNQLNVKEEKYEINNCILIGGSFTFFIIINNKLFSLGLNKDGQLGLGRKSEWEGMTEVMDASDLRCKMDFTLVKKEGMLYSFGTSNYGENGTDSDLLSPYKLPFKDVKCFSAGADFSIVEGEIDI